ncbi:MAG: UvrD-helicase domain-containing protein [Leptospiraceae bacterium]|nr:UvrD-helicase domain-containing protein [Leptospiraceae bacterium]
MTFNEEQEAIINEQSNYVQVIAAAGSGKTSTMIGILDKLIKESIQDLSKVLVLTFSRKAVHEFSERLSRLHPNHNIRIQTFHAHCLGTLKSFHPRFLQNPPGILSEEEKIIFFKNFFKKHRFQIGGIPYKFLLDQNLQILKKYHFDLYQNALIELMEYKKIEDKLEFEDLVSIYLKGLESKEEWTNIPKSNIERLIVDEFQDTDEEQLRFLKYLNPKYLTVVGDDWQAIYGFRGATPKPFLDFEQTFVPTQRHFLSTNYRSLPEIVSLSQKPILENSKFIPKQVNAFRIGKARIEIWKLAPDEFAMKKLSNKILEHMNQFPDTRILCRTNYRKKEFSMAGIPENYLLTIHASKGLEFHSVFIDLISGWNEDAKTIPIDLIEEERRIFYVALSRAKDQIFLLGSNSKEKSNRLEDIFLSYFLKGNKKIKKSVNL